MRILVLAVLAMLAFAGNSLLCRAALRSGHVDPASFTAMRLASGAVALWALTRWRGSGRQLGGSWLSALALFAYAAAFSLAYVRLTAGVGALLLFGSVQASMIGSALVRKERPRPAQWVGLVVAFGGLLALAAPGWSAPPLAGSVLMVVSGIAWAVYTIRGQRAGDPLAATAGNFARAAPMGLALLLAFWRAAAIDGAGAAYALASGIVTSGVGYAIWYSALPRLRTVTAATAQLSVPAIAAIGGVVLLGEPLNLRLALASAAILGGIGLFVATRPQPAAEALAIGPAGSGR